MDVRYPDGSFHNRVLKANRGTVKWSDDLRQRFRSHSEVSSVYESRMLPDGLLYVRYSRCEDRYEKELSTLIESMSDNWPLAIVIDVRGNPGGNTPHKLVGHLISTPIKTGVRKTRCSISELDSQLQIILERGSLSPAVTEALNAAIEAGDLPKGYSPGWITSEGSIETNPIHGRRMNDQALDVAEQLRPLAEAKGCTLSQLALAWCLQQAGVTSPIIGPRTMEQLKDNLAALEVEITDEDRARIDEIVPPGRVVSPFYEANFGPHPYR